MKIKKIIVTYLLILFFQLTGINDNQVYNLLCQNNLPECHSIHQSCQNIGCLLFDIWFQLDLFFSISIEYDCYDNIYQEIHEKMEIIKKYLYQLIHISYLSKNNHRKDLINILEQMSFIHDHQIVTYVDVLNNDFIKCKILLLMLINQ